MDLGSKSMSALRWGAGAKLVGQILNWSMTIFVIRILSPEDYGLVAIAFMFMGFLTLLNEMGLRTVLVQKEDLDDLLIRKIFGVILIVNLVLFAIFFLSAQLISEIFKEPDLVSIIQVLSVTFLITSLEIVPTSLLIRDFDLKKKEITYVISSFLGGVTSLALAIMGYGVWALVIGTITDVLLRTLIINLVCKRLWIPSFSFGDVRSSLSFGGFVFIERAMWSIYTQADIFIIGRTLGKDLLGYYSVAMHLASLIMHKTGSILYNVVLPTFSKVQGAEHSISYLFLKATRLMSFMVFPMFLGMSVVSEDLVLVLLGEKWRVSASLLAILSLVMPFRMLSNLLPPALQGVGEPKKSTTNILIAFISMPIAFLVGVQWGLIGVSIAWVVAFPVAFLLMIHRSGGQLGISVIMFLQAIFMPLVCSILMYILLYVANITLLTDVHGLVRIIADIVIALVLYLVFIKTILKEQFNEVLAAFRK